MSTVSERLERLDISDGPLLRYAGGWLPSGVPSPAHPSVATWVKSCNPRPLVVVDSLAAFYDGDENSANEMRTFLQILRGLADLRACCLLVHHDGKADTAKDYRGSSDFKAAIDAGFHVSNFGPEGKLGLLKLRCFKSRQGFGGDLFYTYVDGDFIRGRGGNETLPTSERFTDLLRANPGVGTRDFQRLAMSSGLSRNQAETWLGEAVLAGAARRESRTGRGGGFRYFLEVGQ